MTTNAPRNRRLDTFIAQMLANHDLRIERHGRHRLAWNIEKWTARLPSLGTFFDALDAGLIVRETVTPTGASYTLKENYEDDATRALKKILPDA